jgi:hypothetical protein
VSVLARFLEDDLRGVHFALNVFNGTTAQPTAVLISEARNMRRASPMIGSLAAIIDAIAQIGLTPAE